MSKFQIIGICVCAVAILFSLYMMNRNIKVAQFRFRIAECCLGWSLAHLDKESAFDWLVVKMPSYERMLFSLKPLKMKYWFTDEQIKKLLEEDEQ